jgi:LmbE family N-acetylglucosaminyl deacetylase
VTALVDRWWPVISGVPEWRPPAVPTLVVVPHPDDEALSTGGLIAWQRRAGVPVRVVAVTDGEAAYPSVAGVELASLRRVEQARSSAHLGVDEGDIIRLGLPDGRVAEHEEHLTEVIAGLLDFVGLVVAPWPNDHHCDHEAAGRAARAALGASGRGDVELVQSLFWTWHHTPTEDLTPATLVALTLDDELMRSRRSAIESHRSQLTDLIAPPILSPADVESASWPREHYVRPGGQR